MVEITTNPTATQLLEAAKNGDKIEVRAVDGWIPTVNNMLDWENMAMHNQPDTTHPLYRIIRQKEPEMVETLKNPTTADLREAIKNGWLIEVNLGHRWVKSGLSHHAWEAMFEEYGDILWEGYKITKIPKWVSWLPEKVYIATVDDVRKHSLAWQDGPLIDEPGWWNTSPPSTGYDGESLVFACKIRRHVSGWIEDIRFDGFRWDGSEEACRIADETFDDASTCGEHLNVTLGGVTRTVSLYQWVVVLSNGTLLVLEDNEYEGLTK